MQSNYICLVGCAACQCQINIFVLLILNWTWLMVIVLDVDCIVDTGQTEADVTVHEHDVECLICCSLMNVTQILVIQFTYYPYLCFDMVSLNT